MSGVTLDAGALIAFERSDRRAISVISAALAQRSTVLVPAGVVAQAWRDGRRQARLSRLLGSPTVRVLPLDDRTARLAGQLCGTSRTADVVDASVVICARENASVVVSADGSDLLRLDADLTIDRL